MVNFSIKSGTNTFGTGKDNDVVFPPELKGAGPDRLGTLNVDAEAKKVELQLAEGVTMLSDGIKSQSKEETVRNMDVVEMLALSCGVADGPGQNDESGRTSGVAAAE